MEMQYRLFNHIHEIKMESNKVMTGVIVAIVIATMMFLAVVLFVAGIRNAREANTLDTEYIVKRIVGDHDVEMVDKKTGQKFIMKVENAHDEAFMPGTVFLVPKIVQQ